MKRNTDSSDSESKDNLPLGSWLRSRDVPIGSLTHFPDQAEVEMSFRRKKFIWNVKEHLCGKDIIPWCDRVDTVGDLLFWGGASSVKEGNRDVPLQFHRQYVRDAETGRIKMLPQSESLMPSNANHSSSQDAEHNAAMLKNDELFQKEVKEITPALPDWVDFQLLQEGCDFYASTWPFVSYSFGWAVMGGFGSEQASEVLLKTRYWGGLEPHAKSELEYAAAVEAGRIDTWRRLRETFCFLYDVSCLGADSFRPELDGEAFRSCTRVRWLHARTRSHIWNTCRPVTNDEYYESSDSQSGISKTAYNEDDSEENPSTEAKTASKSPWNSERLGEPISQGELVGTLLGSSVLILGGMEELAFKDLLCSLSGTNSANDFHLIPLRKKEAFLHLWKVIGFLFGIEEDVLDRCCRDYCRARLVTDSVLLLGIPRNPAPEITGVLVNHIAHSVCSGIKHEFGKVSSMFWYLAPSAETFSMPSWIFLGREHGKAICLPPVSLVHWIAGYLRRVSLGMSLLMVLGWQRAIGNDWGLLTNVMKILFGQTVKKIHRDQPKCRFGKTCPFAKNSSSAPE